MHDRVSLRKQRVDSLVEFNELVNMYNYNDLQLPEASEDLVTDGEQFFGYTIPRRVQAALRTGQYAATGPSKYHINGSSTDSNVAMDVDSNHIHAADWTDSTASTVSSACATNTTHRKGSAVPRASTAEMHYRTNPCSRTSSSHRSSTRRPGSRSSSEACSTLPPAEPKSSCGVEQQLTSAGPSAPRRSAVRHQGGGGTAAPTTPGSEGCGSSPVLLQAKEPVASDAATAAAGATLLGLVRTCREVVRAGCVVLSAAVQR